ncbi:hypothetical protein SAMN04488522_101893 [Pedobacter caeni]|uniref:Uncharacterized protein n=1 Tax=Pedobacter caeni TaxID=288992 RepID=A0A1M4VFV0_9SPHI|nr:hypothetical protein SAMN04488522_101893 [Pedobacter caeni]
MNKCQNITCHISDEGLNGFKTRKESFDEKAPVLRNQSVRILNDTLRSKI